MDGVAAKVAQEVGVFFEYDYIDACACQQVTRHHTRRAAAHDADCSSDTFDRLARVFHGSTPAALGRNHLILKTTGRDDQEKCSNRKKRETIGPKMTERRAAQ